MPVYIYQKETGETVEIQHPIAELDNPSPELLSLITYEVNGEIKTMKRVITAPNLHGFTNGTSTSKKSH